MKRSHMIFLSWTALGRSLLGFQRPCYTPKTPGGALLPQNSCLAPPAPWRTPCSPEKLQQAWPSREKISDGLSESDCPGEEPLGFLVALLHAQALRGCHTLAEQLQRTASSIQEPCSPEKLQQAWPDCEKICLHSQAILLNWAALGKSLVGYKGPR